MFKFILTLSSWLLLTQIAFGSETSFQNSKGMIFNLSLSGEISKMHLNSSGNIEKSEAITSVLPNEHILKMEPYGNEGFVFYTKSGKLFVKEDIDAVSKLIGQNYSNIYSIRSIAVIGTDVYILNSQGSLAKKGIITKSYSQLAPNGTWHSGTQMLAVGKNLVFFTEDGHIYRVHPSDPTKKNEIGVNWDRDTVISRLNSEYFVLRNHSKEVFIKDAEKKYTTKIGKFQQGMPILDSFRLFDSDGLFAISECEITDPQKMSKVPVTGPLPELKANRIRIPICFNRSMRQVFEKNPLRKQFIEKESLTSHQNPDIYILFFDTLRKDDAQKYAPNMARFFSENITPEHHWSSATSTVYVTFALFHSLPPFFTYKYIKTDLDIHDYGSFPLKVLEKLGYDLGVYGRYWSCLDKFETFNKANDWPRFLQSYFDVKTELIKPCTLPGQDSAFKSIFDNKWDDTAVEVAKKEIEHTQKNAPDKPHIFLITLYNNHTPYRWRNLPDAEVLKPSKLDAGAQSSDLDIANVDLLRNSYINSVKFSDQNFKDLLDFIEGTPKGKDSIIILLSDHGESFGEKDPKAFAHGYRAYKERIDAVFSMKFGRDSKIVKSSMNHRIFSTMDFFPTLFDVLDIKPSPSPLLVGRSLLDKNSPRNSTVVIRTNGEKPTYELVVMNDKYKVYLQHPVYKSGINPPMDEKIFYEQTHAFNVFDITDLDDNPVFQQKPFSPDCDPTRDHWSSVKCRDLLLSMFSDGFEDLFPSK